MVRHPFEYAEMLKRRMLKHSAQCWLVNPGWIGGRFGVGKRISIRHTRNLLNAALTGKLDKVDNRKDKILGFDHDDYEDKTHYEVSADFIECKAGDLKPFFRGIIESEKALEDIVKESE